MGTDSPMIWYSQLGMLIYGGVAVLISIYLLYRFATSTFIVKWPIVFMILAEVLTSGATLYFATHSFLAMSNDISLEAALTLRFVIFTANAASSMVLHWSMNRLDAAQSKIDLAEAVTAAVREGTLSHKELLDLTTALTTEVNARLGQRPLERT